ncbi:hypothetical protein QTJ16_003770 [Diplocarpon rosae]|uniref:Uncharacterized protein n=1 Tax=Diplocarpon rosae TaxID=946125 RepID=A0AAD9WCS3_9HELO|nr:hypothetical protein QTJ16_003770 [Diplocarpon rosae]PBP28261.1 hypothetical protein BUE80_DR000662 [Diplocarpon rosae]
MLRPSQSLFFKPVPVLNRLKIHQPLPLTPRELKQLLNLLTTSFRKQLDTEHPVIRPAYAPTPSHGQHPTRRRRHSLSDLDKNPTDRHMHSVLTNPLFNLMPRAEGARPVSLRAPMDLFDQAVAKGMMTTSLATILLRAVKSEITKSCSPDVWAGMKESAAGLKVLKWLVSSGSTNNIEFLDDEVFTSFLMQFLVAEGLQEAAWTWIKKLLARLPALALLSGKEFTEAQKKVVGPLVLLIRAEALDDTRDLDAAYLSLSRAAGYVAGLPTSDVMTALAPAGLFLFKTSVNSHAERPPPSEAGFESFLGFAPVITRRPDRFFAHLSLLHPTKPSPDLALNYIRGIEASKDCGPFLSKNRKPIENSCRYTIKLCLDLATFLLVHHRYSEADEVMNFLRANYFKDTELEELGPVEQAQAEASSLELLEGLILT